MPVGDLNRLNDGERRVLGLLAQGHTVKSIANMTGWTVAAVNERLRSARRKTGMGSSRELARLFAEQFRPKKIGLVANSEMALNVASGAESRRSNWKVATVMMVLLIAAVGAALALQQPQSATQHDPMVGGLLDQPNPEEVLEQLPRQQNTEQMLASEGSMAIVRRLHSQVRTEKRDNVWSPHMEAALRRFFLQVPSVRSSPDHLRVLCSATLCEVTANLPNRPGAAGQLYLPEFQDPKQEAALEKLGLKPLTKVLGSTSAGPLYLSYWGRKTNDGKDNRP